MRDIFDPCCAYLRDDVLVKQVEAGTGEAIALTCPKVFETVGPLQLPARVAPLLWVGLLLD